MLVELRIFDVTLEDSDVYTCICGNAETTATLSVNGRWSLFIISFVIFPNLFT